MNSNIPVRLCLWLPFSTLFWSGSWVVYCCLFVPSWYLPMQILIRFTSIESVINVKRKRKKEKSFFFLSCNYKPDWTQLSVRFSILRAFACIILCVYRSAAPYVVVNHTLITYPRSLLTNVSVWLSSICLLFSETTSPDSSKRSLCSEKLRSDLWECLWKYFWYLALRLLCLVTGLRSTLRRTRRLCAHVEFSCRGDSWLRSVFQ